MTTAVILITCSGTLPDLRKYFYHTCEKTLKSVKCSTDVLVAFGLAQCPVHRRCWVILLWMVIRKERGQGALTMQSVNPQPLCFLSRNTESHESQCPLLLVLCVTLDKFVDATDMKSHNSILQIFTGHLGCAWC